MFAHPIWSVLIAIAPIALYWFVIRPTAPVMEVGKEIEGFWPRTLARLRGFQTWWIATFGAFLIAAPDLIVAVLGHIAPVDFTPILPQPWPAYVSPICLILITVLKAFQTTPPGDPPPEG